MTELERINQKLDKIEEKLDKVIEQQTAGRIETALLKEQVTQNTAWINRLKMGVLAAVGSTIPGLKNVLSSLFGGQ